MVAGACIRPRDPRPTAKASPKANGRLSRTGTQRAVRHSTAGVRLALVKSVVAASKDSLTAICDEGLAELNDFLLLHPDRILVTLRMAKDDSYYRMKVKTSELWIHSTLVYMAGVPKRFWKQLLMEYREAKRPNSLWSDDLLKKMDKMQALDGISNAVSYLGRMCMQDPLPTKLHYKPLLHDVILERMMANSFMLDIETDGSVKFVKDQGVYAFDGLTDTGYSTIVHLPTKIAVTICEDFNVGLVNWSIDNNHDWMKASLRGLRVNTNILQMFVDEGKLNEIGYDKATFLDVLINTHYAKHKGEMAKTASIDMIVQPGELESSGLVATVQPALLTDVSA
jgi:hypothetical protein